MFADELAAERLLNDERTQTRGLGLMVEVDAEDGVLVLVEGQITTDTAPQTGTVQTEHVLGRAVHLKAEDTRLGVLAVDGVAHEALVERSGISTQLLVQCNQHLLLLVELDVSVLLRLQSLVGQRQEHSHDDDYYRSIDNRIGITIRIHSRPPYACTRFARRLIFT